MTNAEKYREIFGFESDLTSCPAAGCCNCPIGNCVNIAKNKEVKSIDIIKAWWNSEYIGRSNEEEFVAIPYLGETAEEEPKT